MHEVLVDRSQLVGQEIVQDLENLRVSLHAASLESAVSGNATEIRERGQSAQARSHSRPAASSMSWICERQAPHPVPAPHASPTSSTVRAPRSITRRTSESVVTWQRQTNMWNE